MDNLDALDHRVSVQVMQEDRAGRNWFALVLVLLLSFSVVINVLQTQKIIGLKAAVNFMKAEMTEARELRTGEAIPVLRVTDINNRALEIRCDETDRPTILYIFTPTCVWCTRNLNNIREIYSKARGRYRILGLSLSEEGLASYAAQHSINFPLYKNPSADGDLIKRLGGTPRTLIVSPDGKLIENWFGAYTGSLKTRVEEYFGFTLPGVAGKDSPESGDRTANRPDAKACSDCDVNSDSKGKTQTIDTR